MPVVGTPRRPSGFWILATGFWLLTSSAPPALAQPTQEDVFRSIQDNVGKPVDGGPILAVLAAAAGGIVLLAVISQRRQRQAAPRPLNHAGRLWKEVTRDLPLRPAEVRQLKLLAEQSRQDDTPVSSPLTLLLCPSLLEKAAADSKRKRLPTANRKALAHLARKLGHPAGAGNPKS